MSTRLARILTWLGIVSLTLLVWGRISTMVTGQDPSIFIALARKLLISPPDSPAFREALLQTAPGFPFLLAFAIKFFGPFSVYYVNLLLIPAFFAVYAGILRRMQIQRPAEEAVAVFLAFLILVFGYRLNPYFLFYPFREVTFLLLYLLGVLLLLQGLTFGRLALAGLCFFLAVAVREVAVFAVLGPIIWLLARNDVPVVRRLKNLGWMLMPFICAGLFGLFVFSRVGRFTTFQFQGWLDRVQYKAIPQMLTELYRMLGFIGDEVGVLGLALLLVGLVLWRRNREMWLFFLLPALFNLLFLSTYIAHRRYFLPVLVFLCPIIGKALVAIFQSLEKWVGKHFRPIPIFWPVAVVLLAMAGVRGSALEPWGPRISKEEVRRLISFTDGRLSAKDGFITDLRCRYLRDAISSYSHLRVIEPHKANEVERWLEQGRRVLYFEPTASNCLYHGTIDGHDMLIPFRSVFEQEPWALVPVQDDSGAQAQVVLGGGVFNIRQLTLPVARSLEIPWMLDSNSSSVCWLDFHRFKSPAAVRVSINDADGAVLKRWDLHIAQGIHGFVLPPGGEARLLVESDQPLPDHLLVAVQRGENPVFLSTDTSRRLSTQYWFHPPYFQPERLEKYAGLFREGGRLCLPSIHGAYRSLEVSYSFGTWPPCSGKSVVTYSLGATTLGRHSARMDRISRHVFVVPFSSEEAAPCVDLSVEFPDGWRGKFSTLQIGLKVLPDEP